VHHTEHHADVVRPLWRALISLGTVGFALVMYRALNLPVVAAILIGFGATTAIATTAWLIRRRDHRTDRDTDTE
jgi:cyanate permease